MPPGDRTGAAWYELSAEDSKLQHALDAAEAQIKRVLHDGEKPVQLQGDERDVVRAAQHAETEVRGVAAAAKPIKLTADAGPLERTLAGLRQRVAGLVSESGGLKGSVLLGAGIGAGVAAWRALSNAVGGFANFIVDAVKAGREENAAIVTLTQSIRANDQAWDGNIAAVEKVIDARQRLGFSDDEQRLSLQRLVAQTHDLDKALELNRTAMDLARLRHIDLATASDLVGKVFGGNIGILARYGIQLERGTTATQALAKIQHFAAGQAEAFANTEEGAAQSSQIALNNLQEDIGRLLLPIVTKLSLFVRDQLVPALGKFVKGIEDVARVLGPVLGPALKLMLPLVQSLAVLLATRLVIGLANSARGMLGLVVPAKAATAALEQEAAAATGAAAASSRFGGILRSGLGAVLLAPVFDNLLTSAEGLILQFQYGEKFGKRFQSVMEAVGGGTYDASEAMHRLDDANEKEGVTLDALTKQFLDLVNSGKDWKTALAEVTDGTWRGSQAWETYEAAASAGAEGAAAAMKHAETATFNARTEIENLRDAAPDAAIAFDDVLKAIDTGYARIREVPGGFAAVIEGGGTIFSDSMAGLAAAIPDAVQKAKDAGVAIAEKIPNDLGSAILGSIDELQQVADRIEEILSGSVSDAAAKAKAAAELLNPGVAKALTGNSSEAKRAMLEDVVNPLIASLDQLTDGAITAGKDLPPAMQRAINAREGDVIAAMRDLVGDSNATLGELKDLAQQQGWDGIVALIDGMEAQQHNVNTKAGEIKAEALRGLSGTQEFTDAGSHNAGGFTSGLDNPGTRAQAHAAGDSLFSEARSALSGSLKETGTQVGYSWGNGLYYAQGYINQKAWAIRNGVSRILEFSGSPAFTHSRWLGEQVIATYAQGFDRAASRAIGAARGIRDRVGGVMGMSSGVREAALGAATGAMPGSSSVTTINENHYHLHTNGPQPVENEQQLGVVMDRLLWASGGGLG